ncbi:rhomboid family intramembrane serine protease [Anaerolentibacter hominis]|uniref:rhomboid family intramembrane serine protease n=1 Tax=Anaerolentibacter hominis TaxID=3079009 RepID=UPI0031B8909C
MIDQIKNVLDSLGYRAVSLNVAGCAMYFTEENAEMYIVALFHCPRGDEFTQAQYEHILYQIKYGFLPERGKNRHILGIICTNVPDEGRKIYSEQYGGWIVDEYNKRLLVYDMPANFFYPVRASIERLLAPFSAAQGSNPYQSTRSSVNQARPDKRKNRFFSPCNTVIIAVNIIVYLVVSLGGSVYDSEYMLSKGAMYWPYVIGGKEYYRLFTYMFLHFGLSHLFNNMLVLWFIGDNLERAVGKVKYLIIYFGTGVLAGAASMIWNMSRSQPVVSVGASGAIFGVVGALLYVVTVNRGRLEDLSTGRLMLFVLLSVYSGIVSQGVDNMAHIGGFISGLVLALILYHKKERRNNGSVW